jgi:hypothetical protein
MKYYEKRKQTFERKLEERGKFKLIGEYFGANGKKMLFECLSCGDKFKRNGGDILRSKYCPKCFKVANTTVNNINKSISRTHPELAKRLLHKKEGELYSRYSGQKLWWKCPDCGTEVKRSPKSFNNEFSCKVCSDGISYPNKFFISFLREAKIDYEPEKVFVWSKFEGSYHFRYDFYIKSKNMIIEIMGGQHYGVNDGWFGNRDIILKTDIEKENLAKLHGISNYIKIDCRISEASFMKKSIIKEMKIFYDLKDLNWKNIKSNSLKSRVIEVCEYYKSHEDISIVKLAKIFNLTRDTVSKYLRRGSDVGICNYSPIWSCVHQFIIEQSIVKEDLEKDIRLISKYYNESLEKSISEISFEFNMDKERIIFCLLSGNRDSLCEFPKYKHLDKKILQFTELGEFITSFDSTEIAGKSLHVTESTINRVCSGKALMCKNYIFRNNSEYPRGNKKSVCQYNLNGVFIKEYPSILNAIKETGTTGIYNAAHGKTKTSGGCVWKIYNK